ncbi:MAG TPA: MFS transporter [Ilumatobacter sp.]|nr:MFS transporter [Ilumatobacter sp.]
MRGALRVPAFRRLTAAWTFSNFGDSALYLTLAVWAKDLTGRDASAGLVFLFLGLPAFLAPVAGQLADRLPRRRLVVQANLVAAALVMALLAVGDAGDVWIIYAVTFGYGLLTYVTSACASGLIRDLLDDDQLPGANGLLQTIDQGMRLLSPLAGVGAYALWGGAAIAALSAATLVIAAGLVATVRMTESGPTPVEQRGTWWAELSAGVRHIRRTPTLARATVLVAVAFSITGLANVAIFAVIDQGLGRSTEFFGVMSGIQGAGSVLGGITAAWLIRRLAGEQAAIGLGLALLAVGVGILLTNTMFVVLGGVFLAGLGIPWCVVAFATVRQRATPAELQGRVSAATNLALNGPQTFGTAAGAALIDVVDYRVMIAVMAVVIGACALAALAPSARRTRAYAS